MVLFSPRHKKSHEIGEIPDSNLKTSTFLPSLHSLLSSPFFNSLLFQTKILLDSGSQQLFNVIFHTLLLQTNHTSSYRHHAPTISQLSFITNNSTLASEQSIAGKDRGKGAEVLHSEHLQAIACLLKFSSTHSLLHFIDVHPIFVERT